MITAEKMKKTANISENYIQEKNAIWTALDTIQLSFLETLIKNKAKNGKTVLNYWHNIRPNVITKLEERGFHFESCIAFWEITWGGQYEKKETNDD